jgi:hypothetical protein
MFDASSKCSCLPAIEMAFELKLIPDIAPREQGWTCKVVVVEKTSSRTSQKGNGTYQHLWLMDIAVIFSDSLHICIFVY